jgi:tetratricopeptide (TPR) repeat protein
MESEVAHLPLWQKAWAWFEANKKQTVWGVGALAVVALVVSFVAYRQNQAAITAAEALSEAELPRMTGASRGNLADAYLKVANTYPGSQAGARALLLAAGALFAEAKYPEAKAQFERFGKDYADSPFRGEALLGIAACLDAQGKATEAMNAYKELIDRRPTDYVLPQARFALARLYEAQNKPELARNLFEEVERNNPYGSLGSEAGMRLEELKAQYPSLTIPPSPALTNTLPLQPQKH